MSSRRPRSSSIACKFAQIEPTRSDKIDIDNAPSVVLRVEQEVGADDGDADGDDGEDEEDEEHEAVDVVDLVGPEGGEDEVHLDEDGAEGQDAAQHDDGQRLHEPLLLRDGPRHGVHAARVIGSAAQVAAQHRPHQGQGQDDEEADAGDSNLGGIGYQNSWIGVATSSGIDTTTNTNTDLSVATQYGQLADYS